MTPTAEEVLNAALELPDDDRLELVEALLVAVEPPARPPAVRRYLARGHLAALGRVGVRAGGIDPLG